MGLLLVLLRVCGVSQSYFFFWLAPWLAYRLAGPDARAAGGAAHCVPLW